MITHLLRTHLCMEPVALATYRNIPSIHPVYKLLSPHLRGVNCSINTIGRDTLVAPGGISDKTLSIRRGRPHRTHEEMVQDYDLGTCLTSQDSSRNAESTIPKSFLAFITVTTPLNCGTLSPNSSVMCCLFTITRMMM